MESRQAFLSRAGAVLLAGVFLFGAGCGPSKKELARRAERERSAAEARAREEAMAAAAEAERQAARAAEEAKAAALLRREADADEAAKAGRLNKALSEFQAVLEAVRSDAAADERLRLKIIAVARAMTPPPPVPEEARRRAVRAQTLVRTQQAAGYAPAAVELAEAVRIAPWWADGYYNLGLMQEGAEDYAAAARSLRLCLKADPDAETAEAVQTKVYELEVLQEEADKVRGMAGAWTNKTTGNVYTATMNGKSFYARNKNGFEVRAVKEGLTLDGTLTVPAQKAWNDNDCWTPSYTAALTGRISQDLRTLTFEYMENSYNASFWRVTGSGPNTTGHKDGDCSAVTLTGSHPSEMVLIR